MNEVDIQAIELLISNAIPILDIRDPKAYVELHLQGATNLAWNELGSRINELPPRVSVCFESILN
jgi:rhodanese-related sulfurtransferase